MDIRTGGKRSGPPQKKGISPMYVKDMETQRRLASAVLYLSIFLSPGLSTCSSSYPGFGPPVFSCFSLSSPLSLKMK